MTKHIPEGYRENANGCLVPEDQIKPIDLLRDELVLSIIEKAQALREAMTAFKLETMGEIADFVDLSAAEYNVKFGGSKGNVQLHSFNGRYRIARAVSEHRVFDERIQAAKTLIDECIKNWSDGADSRLMAMVDHAFRTNKQGRIDINQVLSLRSLDISDEKWKQAMDAIADAIQITGSSQYLRIYERNEKDGGYKQLPLDISTL
ncbi:DUF3164 family protein [Agarivorans sp. B2Z047]|uniref:DUF3164 family protein n=1 Tax=Agarivorans sp. B2Z047 TaxID=2652721 RepID=UPI00128E7DA7|nr:DUF3164 family protein [Agarivorans sp. B2Z047]MPW30481.1 DUF3164 family protein [Agarivorans sp. B2Z047]UQN42299.1 DUF3164 family protein [Agarivorans sp. B2Z047]